MLHFFDPSNPRMVSKLPALALKVDVLLGNLEDAVQADNKKAARAGLVEVARKVDRGDAAPWTRVNSLDSPWILDDLTTLVTEVGDELDVIMVPKVEGLEDRRLRLRRTWAASAQRLCQPAAPSAFPVSLPAVLSQAVPHDTPTLERTTRGLRLQHRCSSLLAPLAHVHGRTHLPS